MKKSDGKDEILVVDEQETQQPKITYSAEEEFLASLKVEPITKI